MPSADGVDCLPTNTKCACSLLKYVPTLCTNRRRISSSNPSLTHTSLTSPQTRGSKGPLYYRVALNPCRNRKLSGQPHSPPHGQQLYPIPSSAHIAGTGQHFLPRGV